MAPEQSLFEYYNQSCKLLPKNRMQGVGHVNVFPFRFFRGLDGLQKSCRRDYYQITLVVGSGFVLTAHEPRNFHKGALFCSGPFKQERWQAAEDLSGYVLFFDPYFFSKLEAVSILKVFNPEKPILLDPSPVQLQEATNLFEYMLEELSTDYIFKYDRVKTLILELLHAIQKMQYTW